MIKIEVRYVNGDMSEFEENDSFISNLRNLESKGLVGKALIDSLITDDWGVPPSGIIIKGKRSNGAVIKEVINYN
ncbi:MAG: hypothetical protein ACI9TV_000237 [Sulfurimonas sp.]|jgi:hypothetical protein|uniref:hypothetical protein n=1 Tax=Sulfurimonas sp. TaxID=2022749 RepID=UPI0039E63AC1